MPIRLKNTFSLILASILLMSCGQNSSRIDLTSRTKEAWNALNDPLNLKDDYEVTLSKLPLNAELSKKPWSDTYWPNYQGGLANRWNDPDQPDSFAYQILSATQVASLSDEDLRHLSPAEKYDIYMGRLDFPFVREERQRTSADDPTWYGLCHGWAPAALNYAEPNPVTVTSERGIQVPFGSSDIKALLLFAQQYGDDSRMAGDRCNDNDGSGPACKDINAGSFHVILTNQIGISDQGFVAEVAKGEEVWNQPVKAYSYNYFNLNTDVISENIQDSLLKVSDIKNDKFAAYRAPGTVYVIGVEMKLAYVSETRANRDKVDIEENDSIIWLSYRYDLELDAKLNIIGGEWYSEAHPDFVWNPIKNSRPVSSYDKALGTTTWDTQAELLPLNWAKWGQVASEQGQVIHRIIESIVDRSSSK